MWIMSCLMVTSSRWPGSARSRPPGEMHRQVLRGPGPVGDAARPPRAGDVTRREPGEDMSCLELAASPGAPFWARRNTAATSHAWQLRPDTLDSRRSSQCQELATNAIKAPALRPGQV